jgi:hypothetical protein
MRAEPISPKGIPDQEAYEIAKDAKAPFTLIMQLYSPKTEVLDGTWTPSDMKRQACASKKVA